MKKRRRARELALQGLYGWEISGNEIESVVDRIMQDSEKDDEIIEFASALLKRTIRYKDALDEHIVGAVKNWEFERIALLDRIVLRMALCEILYFEEIPPKVTINEAIDLAKQFSTEQSGRFVNGILDSIYRKMKTENLIKKSGRGLVG